MQDGGEARRSSVRKSHTQFRPGRALIRIHLAVYHNLVHVCAKTI